MNGQASVGPQIAAEDMQGALRARRPDGRLVCGLAIVGLLSVAALAAARLAPADPHAYVAAPLAAPSARHLLGADDAGSDILSQLLYGARVSLLVGLLVGVLATAIAWTVGLLSGLSGGADVVARGAIDLVLLLPPLPAVILIAAYLGASVPVVVITLALISWAAFARVIRAQVQSEVRKAYVEAARATGASGARILLRHVAPATVPVAMAKFVLTVQYAVVVQASLAFLGLGDAATVSWGGMLHRAAQSPVIFLSNVWAWWLLPPALAIALLVVGFALVGWSIEERSLPSGRA